MIMERPKCMIANCNIKSDWAILVGKTTMFYCDIDRKTIGKNISGKWVKVREVLEKLNKYGLVDIQPSEVLTKISEMERQHD